jgi:hypothetical protein
MIETIAALVALMTAVQTAMVSPDYAWPLGRSWGYSVKSTITDAQLTAAAAPCCSYLTVDGKILRVGGVVWLIKVR